MLVKPTATVMYFDNVFEVYNHFYDSHQEIILFTFAGAPHVAQRHKKKVVASRVRGNVNIHTYKRKLQAQPTWEKGFPKVM